MRRNGLKNSFFRIIVVVYLCSFSNTALSKENPNMNMVDRIRLHEAFNLSEKIGEKIWHDWNKTPFAVLLVTPEYEFLVRHSAPPDEFTFVVHDSLLKSNIYFRKKVYQTNFLATLPVNGVPTVVVGQAENTSAKTSTQWIITLLHEHFHQRQYSNPDYYSAVNALNLSGGDSTGMWMLNYRFPYDSVKVNQQFSLVTKGLSEAIAAIGSRDFLAKLSEYLNMRNDFKNILTEDDYKYFSFQLWQEGIARLTEYQVAKTAAASYTPTANFKSLSDFTPLKYHANSILENILTELKSLSLKDYQRVAFYYIGAGEGLLLEALNDQWKRQYFTTKFFLEEYFKTEKNGN